MLPGVAFSNTSMTSFPFNPGPVRSDFRHPPLFLEGNFFLFLFKFKLTRTRPIFGYYGILALMKN